jgi:hypothetical protein
MMAQQPDARADLEPPRRVVLDWGYVVESSGDRGRAGQPDRRVDRAQRGARARQAACRGPRRSGRRALLRAIPQRVPARRLGAQACVLVCGQGCRRTTGIGDSRRSGGVDRRDLARGRCELAAPQRPGLPGRRGDSGRRVQVRSAQLRRVRREACLRGRPRPGDLPLPGHQARCRDLRRRLVGACVPRFEGQGRGAAARAQWFPVSSYRGR